MNQRACSAVSVTANFPRFSGEFAGSFIFRFAKYLVRERVQVIVVALGAVGFPAKDNSDRIEVYRFPYFYPKRYQRLAYNGGEILANIHRSRLASVQVPLLLLATTWAILRYQDRFDLMIHCYWLPTAVAALIARPFSRIKPALVFTNWGPDTRLCQWINVFASLWLWAF